MCKPAADGYGKMLEYGNEKIVLCGANAYDKKYVKQILEGNMASKKAAIIGFHDMLYDEYQRISSGERNVLFKMKEFWSYLGTNFEGSEKLLKKIKKTERLKEYDVYVKALFDTLE